MNKDNLRSTKVQNILSNFPQKISFIVILIYLFLILGISIILDKIPCPTNSEISIFKQLYKVLYRLICN